MINMIVAAFITLKKYSTKTYWKNYKSNYYDAVYLKIFNGYYFRIITRVFNT